MRRGGTGIIKRRKSVYRRIYHIPENWWSPMLGNQSTAFTFSVKTQCICCPSETDPHSYSLKFINQNNLKISFVYKIVGDTLPLKYSRTQQQQAIQGRSKGFPGLRLKITRPWQFYSRGYGPWKVKYNKLSLFFVTLTSWRHSCVSHWKGNKSMSKLGKCSNNVVYTWMESNKYDIIGRKHINHTWLHLNFSSIILFNFVLVQSCGNRSTLSCGSGTATFKLLFVKGKTVKKVKVSLFNVGSTVSLKNWYQWKPTVRPLPPPSVSTPFYGFLKLKLHRSEKSRNRRWSQWESNWGPPAQKAAHLPTVLHACSLYLTSVFSLRYEAQKWRERYDWLSRSCKN